MSSQPQRRGVVAVIARNGRLLAIRRSELVVAPGKICFPGGGIETNENEHDALVREIQEELAVSIRPTKQLWTSVTPWNTWLAWWEAELSTDQKIVPNPEEIADWSWMTPGQMAAHVDLLESNHSFLQQLAERQFSINGL